MKSPITAPWGKLSKEDGSWHPLTHHSIDVAACAHALLTNTLLGKKLAAWGSLESFDDVQVSRLAVLAALHDLGKFNHGFQAKGLWPTQKSKHAGHVQEVMHLLGFSHDPYTKALEDAIDFETLKSWGPKIRRLLYASICHHGEPKLPLIQPAGWTFKWWTEEGGDGDPLKEVKKFIADLKRWFPLAFTTGGAPLPSQPRFQHGFSGLVIEADWLGSDTEFFPFSTSLDGDARLAFALAKAEESLWKKGIDIRRNRASLSLPTFSSISPFTPRPLQQKIESLTVDPEGSLLVLEDATGSGKTEAAILWFLKLFHAGLVDGMYFALPTRASAVEIYQRVLKAVKRGFPKGAPPVILAVPEYFRVDGIRGSRFGYGVLWDDDDKNVRYRGWAAEGSKRYLAGAIVVGTIDQTLLSTLQTSHSHLRATCLARQLLIVDEVHASDVYMAHLLEAVLKYHLQCKSHALLMSATLGSKGRHRFLKLLDATTPSMPVDEATRYPYPALTYSTASSCRTLSLPATKTPKEVFPQILPLAGNYAATAKMALSAAKKGAKVLVIRNLVDDCIQTQKDLILLAKRSGDLGLCFQVQDLPTPHHSRYARIDRRLLDGEVLKVYGKERAHQGGCVLVSTQTLEQSLDLDADLIITDLCPMDVLQQRFGRLHRHTRHRPPSFEKARIVILVPEDRDLRKKIASDGRVYNGSHGHGSVYQDLRVLEATWRLCETSASFVIPHDNRRLVEAVTHDDALAAIVGGDPVWKNHAAIIKGGIYADVQTANDVSVDRELPFGKEPFRGEDAFVGSRLGNYNRRVRVVRTRGPFQRITELTIPHHMVEPKETPVPKDPLPTQSAPNGFTFTFGDKLYLYSNFGLTSA